MVRGICMNSLGRWSDRRRGIQRLLLQSMREALAEATPVIDGIATPPADAAALDATRARIAAALSEADRIEAALVLPMRLAGDDAVAIAAAVALADQMSLDRLGWKAKRKRK